MGVQSEAENQSASSALPRVLVSVLSYNSAQNTVDTLRSLERQTYPNYHLQLVDNASTDDSLRYIARMFHRLDIKVFPENLGYTGGNNWVLGQGLAEGYDYIILCNHDIEVDEQVVAHLVETATFHRDTAGVVGGIEVCLNHAPRRRRAAVATAKYSAWTARATWLPQAVADDFGPLEVSCVHGALVLFTSGDTETAFAAYRRLILLCTGISIVTALSLWAGNRAFVARWVGAALYGGTWLDAALALNLIVAAWTLSSRTMLTAMIMARPLALSRTVEATLNLGLSIVLAQRVGLTGIAVATAIAALLTSCWYIPRLVLRRFRRNFRELARHTLVPLAPLALILLPVALLMRFLVEGTGIGGSLLAMCAVSAPGFALLWWFAFDSDMRARTIGIAAQTLRALQKRLPVVNRLRR